MREKKQYLLINLKYFVINECKCFVCLYWFVCRIKFCCFTVDHKNDFRYQCAYQKIGHFSVDCTKYCSNLIYCAYLNVKCFVDIFKLKICHLCLTQTLLPIITTHKKNDNVLSLCSFNAKFVFIFHSLSYSWNGFKHSFEPIKFQVIAYFTVNRQFLIISIVLFRLIISYFCFRDFWSRIRHLKFAIYKV